MNIGRIGLSEKGSKFFVFKIITKYFQYENFLLLRFNTNEQK